MNRLFLCVVGLGLFSGVMGLVLDCIFLRPSYLPNRSERELRMARWRGVGSSVAVILLMWNMAMFLQDPHQMIYLRLAMIAGPVGVVLSAMNIPLQQEARQARRERKRRATP